MSYVISGNITGQYSYPVIIKVIDEFNRVYVAENVTTEYSITVEDGKFHTVVLIPQIGNLWTPNTHISIGDLIYPENNYYYKAITAGITAQLKPLFNANPVRRIHDNSIDWGLVERVPPPLINYPIIPTEVYP